MSANDSTRSRIHSLDQETLEARLRTTASELFPDRLMDDLGIRSPDQLRQRTEDVRAAIPQVTEIARTIVDAHPDVVAAEPSRDLDTSKAWGGVLLRDQA